MKYKDLSHASTAPEYCCLLSITAIAHKAFCLRKPEEVIFRSVGRRRSQKRHTEVNPSRRLL